MALSRFPSARTGRHRVRLAMLLALTVGGMMAIVPSAALANSTGQCSNDSSFSYQVCVTLNWTPGSLNGVPTATVNNYQIRFTRLDPTVSISGARWSGGLNGFDTGGNLHFQSVDSGCVGGCSPASGVTYSYAPYFAGYTILTNSPFFPYFYESLRADATLSRGGTSWSIHSVVACVPGSHTVC